MSARGDDKAESAPSPQDEGEAATTADLANLAPDARLARLSELARVLDVQLALLHRRQAHPHHGEDMRAINAEVKHVAATAAIIENQLQKLEGRGAPLPSETRDSTSDDLPEDIDAFRLRLAAKIEAFLERRPDVGDGDADAATGRDRARP